MIIRGGFNIYPREIEEVLHEHPTSWRPRWWACHDELGEDVGAAVVVKPGHQADPEEIKGFGKALGTDRMYSLGAFALTEPDHGSDSVSLETTARRDGEDYVIDGAKRWIGNGSIADVVVVWARDTDDGQVKGFLIEHGSPRYNARVIEGKGSFRSVWQAEIELSGVRVPADSRLPGANSFKDTGRVLASTRLTAAFAALGHAVGSYDAALSYCRTRKQFGKPLISFQIVQERLVRMLAEVTAMHLYCLRVGRLGEQNGLRDRIAGLAKVNNTEQGAARDRRGSRPTGRQRHLAREPRHPPQRTSRRSTRSKGPRRFRR